MKSTLVICFLIFSTSIFAKDLEFKKQELINSIDNYDLKKLILLLKEDPKKVNLKFGNLTLKEYVENSIIESEKKQNIILLLKEAQEAQGTSGSTRCGGAILGF